MKKCVTNVFFVAVKPFATAPVSLKVYDSPWSDYPWVEWFRWRNFEHLL